MVVGYDTTKVGSYQLSDIRLEYQVLRPDDPVDLPTPPRNVYNHVVHHATIPFDRATKTLLLDTIQIQRKSFVGVLGLFVAPFLAGGRDSEAFVDPGITKVEFDLDGQLNVLYPDGMLPSDLWRAALSGAE